MIVSPLLQRTVRCRGEELQCDWRGELRVPIAARRSDCVRCANATGRNRVDVPPKMAVAWKDRYRC
jgi:hypothetical protein